MANVRFATSNILGVDLTQVNATQTHELGKSVDGTEGGRFVFCQANGAITGDGYVCIISESFQADMIETTLSATGFGEQVGVAMSVWADNEYGWIQVRGTAVIRVLASAAADTTLNTTATAGALDDDATAGSEDILGLAIKTANGGSAATVEGYLSNATVGTTNA